MRPLRLAAAAILLGPLFCVQSWANSNTNVRFETEGLDANSWLNQKFNQPEEKFGVAVNESTSLGFNEEGDPSMAMTF